ncbi:MAG: PBP1A family penicillin-binding protein [bacterium]
MPIPTLKPRARSTSAPWRSSGPSSRLHGRGTSTNRFDKKRFWLRIVLPVAVGLFLVGVIGVVAAFAWFSRDLPDTNGIIDRTVAQSTKIYARDGSTLLYEVHGEERRTLIDLEQIPEHMKWATIDIEDKDFYKHGGVDLRGIFRAVIINIINLDTTGQGGSTITQQFIKNAILTTEKSYVRKIKEAVLAYQIEKRFTKDQILKLYFNEIPYGRNAYGVEAAAEAYFGKSASQLTLDEASLLASLPQAPTYYSPDGNNVDILLGRQETVLNNMVAQGHITEQEAEAAKAINTLEKIQPRREAIKAPHFVIYVRELLTEKFGEKIVEQGGLKVITTLEPNLQIAAEESVAEGIEKIERYGGSNASLVSINPITGQILAMVGSRDYFDKEHDGNVNVALRLRQPGSSFKPIVYAQAFREGYTPETILFDLITNFGGSPAYIPRNYDGSENGPVPMRKALAGSLNIPAVKTLYLAGINDVLDLAGSLGYTSLTDPDRYGLSLTLGGGEVRLLEHVAAFGVFANDGVRQTTTAILRIEDQAGKVLEENKEGDGERVLEEDVARLINNVLSDNGARAFTFGTSNYLTLGGRPVAAKTGTTNDYRDAWTIGYTPNLVTGVWVGNNDNTEMGRGAAGSVVAAPVWNNFMKKATSGAEVVYFRSPKPNNADKPILQGRVASGNKVKLDTITGREIPVSCVDSYPENFIVERELEEIHSILYFVDKNKPRGPQPDNPGADPQFNGWEAPVLAWVESEGKLSQRPEQEDCDLRSPENNPVVELVAPEDGALVEQASLLVDADVTSSRSINFVEFFVDGALSESITAPTYRTTLDLSGLENGFHTLLARATDEIEQTGKVELSFNLQLEGGTLLYFTEPVSGEGFAINTAVDLVVFATTPNGVDEISFTVTGAGSGQRESISAKSQKNNLYSASWLPEVAGEYRITATLLDNDGNATISDGLGLVVN